MGRSKFDPAALHDLLKQHAAEPKRILRLSYDADPAKGRTEPAFHDTTLDQFLSDNWEDDEVCALVAALRPGEKIAFGMIGEWDHVELLPATPLEGLDLEWSEDRETWSPVEIVDAEKRLGNAYLDLTPIRALLEAGQVVPSSFAYYRKVGA